MILWVVTLCNVVVTNVWEESTALMFNSEGDNFLQNVGATYKTTRPVYFVRENLTLFTPVLSGRSSVHART
jgi:hypothetical protein